MILSTQSPSMPHFSPLRSHEPDGHHQQHLLLNSRAQQVRLVRTTSPLRRKSLAAAAPWTSMNPLVPQERRSAPPFARPAQRQRHHPLALLWIAAQRTFQSSAQPFRPSAPTQMAPGHRESIRARHTVTLRISWSSLGFWSAATRKKGEKEAHDGSVAMGWPRAALNVGRYALFWNCTKLMNGLK